MSCYCRKAIAGRTLSVDGRVSVSCIILFFRLGTAGRSFRVDGRVGVICTESYNELLF